MIVIINKLLALSRRDEFSKIFRYLVIGVLTTLVSFGTYRFLYNVINIEVNISNVISILLAITFAYFANKIYVFKSQCASIKLLLVEFFAFYWARFISMCVEVLGVFILHNLLLFDAMLAKIVISIIIILLNYILSKFWVFKNSN